MPSRSSLSASPPPRSPRTPAKGVAKPVLSRSSFFVCKAEVRFLLFFFRLRALTLDSRCLSRCAQPTLRTTHTRDSRHRQEQQTSHRRRHSPRRTVVGGLGPRPTPADQIVTFHPLSVKESALACGPGRRHNNRSTEQMRPIQRRIPRTR